MRNAGDAEFLNLVTMDSIVSLVPPTRILGSDREGRVYQSVGTARSKVEQTDWHEQDEERFVADVAAKLSALACAEDIQNLVLVAPLASSAGCARSSVPAHAPWSAQN